jgi:DNA-binding phage protein
VQNRQTLDIGLSQMPNKLIPFDVADYLGSEEAIAEYVSQVLADGDTDELQRALVHVAKARDILKSAHERPPVVTRPTE